MTKLTANPKAALFLGVLGVSFFVRWSQAPSLFTATCRLGWTVVLLLDHSLDRDRLWGVPVLAGVHLYTRAE